MENTRQMEDIPAGNVNMKRSLSMRYLRSQMLRGNPSQWRRNLIRWNRLRDCGRPR